MHQEIEKFAYNALKEYFDAKDSYVLFRLGQILVRGNHFAIDRYFGGIALSDAFVYDNFANAIRKETRKELTDEQLYFLGKKLLVGAYEQGSDIALIELGRVEGDYALKAYNILKDKGLVDCEVTLKLATEYKKEKNYKQAVIVLEEGLKNENGEEVFAEEILRILELTDISLAKNFIIGFLDKVEEGEIRCNCTNFVTNEIIPRVLNKKSYCYQPRYAIKILQSKYFSSPYADYQLGCIYADGEHIRKDIKTAISYFEKAASKEVGSAYYKLGYLYYYGSDGVGKSNIKAKEYFEKALYCGENCEFAYEMVRVDLGEQDGPNLMREYANEVIKETKIGKERNKKIQDDLKEDFGEYWDKLQEKTRDFIYSGIKTYINNYEEDDARYDYSAAINPMAKSLECELGEIFYTKYVKWLQEKGVDVEEYFSEINVKFTSYDKRFTLGLLSFLTHGKKQHFYEYDSAKQYVKENKIPAIVQPNGKGAKVLQLHSKFYDYVNEMFSSDAFSREERQQEITAFIFNLVNLVEDVRENLRNEADHTNLMKVGHAEACGNILYKTRKVIYNLVSKLK
jgi:TPR repeat protein